MHSRIRPLLKVVLLATAACAIGAMFGCGSSGPAGPKAATHLYVVQNTSSNNTESDSILTFSTKASGASTPSSTLLLPTNFVAFSVAVAPSGVMYVGGAMGESTGAILVFAAGATGSATPTATLTGGGTGTFAIPLFISVNSKGQLYVLSSDYTVESFAAGVTSASSPLQYLTFDVTLKDGLWGVGADSAGDIFLADEDANTVDVFAAGANGAAAPTRTITGAGADAFSDMYGMAVDDAGDVTVTNYNEADDPFGDGHGHPVPAALRRFLGDRLPHRRSTPRPQTPPVLASTSVFLFAAGASGNATPLRALSGELTNINEPEGVAIDAVGNLYYEDYENGAVTVMVFPAASTGNVAPAAAITSTAFSDSYFGAIAVL